MGSNLVRQEYALLYLSSTRRDSHGGGGEVDSPLSLGRRGEYMKGNRILMYTK